jgi:hypothetical protein
MNNWNIIAATEIGKSHKDGNIPCQDAYEILQNNNWSAIVVSDGAGTAKYAEIGSKFVAQFFAKSLMTLSSEIDKKGPGSWINDFLIQQITEIRSLLRIKSKSDRLNDYHCTLVACLLGETGGFSIHIGDGAIFGGKASKEKHHTVLSNEKFSSLPENGEYANETFFITENTWIKHLRVTPISDINWVCLGTDGGMSLAMQDEKLVKTGFIIPLLKVLVGIQDSKQREIKLSEVLSDEKSDKLTGDDKTLCIAFKNNFKNLPNEFIYHESIKQNSDEKNTAKKTNLVKKNFPEEPVDKSRSFTDKEKKNYFNSICIFSFLIFSSVASLIYLYFENEVIKEIPVTEEAPQKNNSEEAPKEEATTPAEEAPKEEAATPAEEAPKEEATTPAEEAPKEEAATPAEEDPEIINL